MSRMRSMARSALVLRRDVAYDVRFAIRSTLHARRVREVPDGARPDLSAVEERVAADLARDGIAIASAADLLDASDIDEVDETTTAWAASDDVQRHVLAFDRGERTEAYGKDFLVRMFPEDAEIRVEEPILRATVDGALLRIATRYLGVTPRVRYVDAWLTIPTIERDADPVASQRWHRDWEDRKQIKVFLYHTDVTPENGALEYVRDSRRSSGPHARWSRRRSQLYPDPAAFDRRIDPSEIVSAAGPRSTLVFCDTTGLHRGGRAVASPRLLSTWLYVTPVSMAARRFRPVGDASPLTAEQRMALEL